jgi:hydrogenase expression/formation protein HypC
MCIGIPMQVLECGEFRARCHGRHGEASIDLSLVGPQPVGSWLLIFLDAAREVIDETRARDIDAALDALDAALAGESNLDAYFADLTGREPQLPDFLRKDLP